MILNMTIPDVDIPVRAVRFSRAAVEKALYAAERVWDRMHRTAAALNEARVPFVVIGGNAVGVWVATRDEGAVRNTPNVNILMDRRDWARAIAAMSASGFDAANPDGLPVFLDRNDPSPRRGVHVHFAGEPIRPGASVIAPAVKVGIAHDGVPALDLKELIVLKLSAFRNIDRVHIRDMIRVGLISDAIADQIPAELRLRLEEIRANPDG